MGRRAGGERVLGPYRHGARWHVVCVGAGASGARSHHYFEAEADALNFRSLAEESIIRAATTIAGAIDEYEKALVAKGNKPRSYRETLRRLKVFFTDIDLRLDMLAPSVARRLFAALTARKPPLAVDSRLNYLAEARTFLDWCVKQRWLRANPLAGVKGEGKRRHGKPQLRIDEARAWMAKALELAPKEAGAVAALVALLLGMRAGEIVDRQVRDVDDDGRLLWIPDSKTKAGRRTLEVPAVLQPLLLQLAGGRDGQGLLFGKHWRDWPREWIQRICEVAKVPRVTAHGMRGLHATLAVDAGVTGHMVATALGHESFAITAQSYASPASTDRARRRKVLGVLDGGRDES